MSIIVEFQNLVEKESYDKALGLLLQNKQEFEPGVFYYNKGVLEARREDFVAARVSLEKSIKEGYLHKDLVKNLEMIKNNLGVDYLEQNNDFQTDFINTTLSFEIYTSLIISSLVLISLHLLFKNIKSLYTTPLILLISALPTVFHYYLKDNYEIVVISEETIMRKGPSKIFEEEDSLPAGMKLTVKKKLGDWTHIVSPSSHQGWIYKAKVEKL